MAPLEDSRDREPSANAASVEASLRPERILVHHGVSELAAAAIVALASQLRAMSAQAGVEAAAMIDAESGEQLGEVLPGGPYGVLIRPHLDLMRGRSGRRF